jgi:hypothetical protein
MSNWGDKKNDNPFGDFADFSYFQSFNNFWSRSEFEIDPVLEQCKKDAIEYFENVGLRIGTTIGRLRLSKEQRERVIEFLKSRKKYYDENGFLMPNE